MWSKELLQATIFEEGTLNLKIHSTHHMIYRPCLFYECEFCYIDAIHGAEELAQPCEGLTFSTTQPLLTGAQSNG